MRVKVLVPAIIDVNDVDRGHCGCCRFETNRLRNGRSVPACSAFRHKNGLQRYLKQPFDNAIPARCVQCLDAENAAIKAGI
jgi:hypothetical protein